MENSKNKYIIDLAEDLARQAFELMPNDIDNDTKIYIKNAIVYYPKLLGETILKDNDSITEAELEYIVQIPAEWIYHKMVDLYRSNVSREHWECIINVVINAISECIKELGFKALGNIENLNKVEAVVLAAYDNKLQELLNNNLITEEIYEDSKKHSNIDEMAQEINKKKADDNVSMEEMFAKNPFIATISFLLLTFIITKIIIYINMLFKHFAIFVKHSILFMQVNLLLPSIIKNNLKFLLLWFFVFIMVLVIAKVGSGIDKKDV